MSLLTSVSNALTIHDPTRVLPNRMMSVLPPFVALYDFRLTGAFAPKICADFV